MYKVCVITATRAEYGLLKPVISKLDSMENVRLMLAVTGMHLSKKYGYTVEEIVRDSFDIDRRIDIGIDDGSTITGIMGRAIEAFGQYFESDKPDILVLLGDRYEMLSIAAAAMVYNVPIAHIHGGEVTEGAIDDAIRHSITKMSYLHFASTEEYRKRIIQMGEAPERVFNVGALGIENIKDISSLSKEELEDFLGIRLDSEKKTAVLTYHPETIGNLAVEIQIKEVLRFVEAHKEMRFIITGANADKNGDIINDMLSEYAGKYPDRCRFFMSLGQRRYLSLLRYCDFVIGNSSSGIIEVPSFGIPTINIGARQRGRVRAKSVIDCECAYERIEEAYGKAQKLQAEPHKVINPYEGINTSETIVDTIICFLENGIDLRKKFYDISR